MSHRQRSLFILLVLFTASSAQAAEHVLTPRLHHLRAGDVPEWADFPKEAEGPRLLLPFQAERNVSEWTLRPRQQDVRQTWKVLLNGKDLGRPPPDENDQVLYLPVPAGALVAGANNLVIEQVGKIPDDVRIGEIALDSRPVNQVLSEATVEIEVSDDAGLLPCRLTILDAKGALATTGATSGGDLAVRPGVIYTGTGRARFGMPAGSYTIHAGRGFEYGLDTVRLTLRPGDLVRKTLTIRREVPTPGYICCDTHVHTLTHSGHGDATVDERVLTLAGEGVELPIITEHNLQVDYNAAMVRRGVQKYFTPVVGNEVTTPVGHFNIFPVRAGPAIPDFKLKHWKSVFQSIDEKTAAPVVILNHPRDVHAGFRPFGPERHLGLTGQDLEGWELRANAVELVTSGALQSDPMRTVRDWFGLLNRGRILTPVGASDSHDVSRYIVGQGRTYIRCRDEHPDDLDVKEVVENFRQGRVLVSCGLLTEIKVEDHYGPGDLVGRPQGQMTRVNIRVLGPRWVRPDRVELYVNGILWRAERITPTAKSGVLWEGGWGLPVFGHDVHVVAVASGPGVRELYWPIARPYQPTSPMVERRVIGISGMVWLDCDRDGRRTSAYDYARRIIEQAGQPLDLQKLRLGLGFHDEAVATQVASLLQERGISLTDPAVREVVRIAGEHATRGFQAFAEAWRESQLARSQGRPGR
jgi:hypothetical protein